MIRIADDYDAIAARLAEIAWGRELPGAIAAVGDQERIEAERCELNARLLAARVGG